MHVTGGVMLAGTRARLDWLKMTKARGRYLGMELELVSVDEAARLFPLMNKKHFVGALYDPIEGHVDPYGVTQAYAKAAQLGGAEVVRHNRVLDLKARRDGSWDVITEQGNVHAEHVVNAGGLWAREVGRMVGLELPVLAMEHQYLITEDLPQLKGQKEQLHCIDFEGEIYTRQERGGMLLGTYERAGVPWSPRETPVGLRARACCRMTSSASRPSLEVGFEHFPALGEVGIRKVVNGPFTFAPDGNPLVGPGARAAELLGGLRRHGRLQPGRRRRTGAVAVDGERRSGRGRVGDGRRALRRLGDARLYQRQGARELLAALPHPLPERGAAGGAPVAHHADLRATAGPRTPCSATTAGWSMRCGSHPSAARRARRSPSTARTRTRTSAPSATAVRSGVGLHRDLQLRQVRGHRSGRRGVALAT